MKLFHLTTTALSLLPSTLAWSCLSDSDAQTIVDKSILFLQHKNPDEARAVAYDLFDPQIKQYGDSINFLRGAPLGTPVYENATAYVEGTLSAPGIPNVRIPHPQKSLPLFHDTLCLTVADMSQY